MADQVDPDAKTMELGVVRTGTDEMPAQGVAEPATDEVLYTHVDLTGPRYEPPQGTYPAAIEELNRALDELAIYRAQAPGHMRAVEQNRETIQGLEQELVEARSEMDRMAREHQAVLINHHDQARALHEARHFVASILGQEDADAWVSRPPLPAPPQLAEPLQAIIREYWSAKQKHGENCIDGAGYTHFQRLAIVMEELGEVAHELTYDQGAGEDTADAVVRLWKELVQTGAMVGGWLAFMWQQYGAVLASETAEVALEVTRLDDGATVHVKRRGLPAVPSAFAAAVHELTGQPTCPRPDRGPDLVGRDLEGRYWSLWNDEGLKCYLPSRAAVDADLARATYPSLVNLTRVDLATYADAGERGE